MIALTNLRIIYRYFLSETSTHALGTKPIRIGNYPAVMIVLTIPMFCNRCVYIATEVTSFWNHKTNWKSLKKGKNYAKTG